jgi:hypothetical protein
VLSLVVLTVETFRRWSDGKETGLSHLLMDSDGVLSASIPTPSTHVKWKNKKFARSSSGMAELVKDMQASLPLTGVLHCGFVWLEPSESEVDLLERGGFGKALPGADILRKQGE